MTFDTQFQNSVMDKIKNDNPSIYEKIRSVKTISELGALQLNSNDGSSYLYFTDKRKDMLTFAYKEICDEVIYILTIQWRLKMVMLKNKINSQELSEISKVPFSIIEYYIRDKFPTFHIPTLKRLCDSLNISMGSLLDK